MKFELLPKELRDRPQWVVWRSEERNGRSTKVPYHVSGRRASSTNPSTWCGFPEALAAFRSDRFTGLGFVLTEDDPYVGLDFDKAIDSEGNTKPWAADLLALLPSTAYVEVSPSGTGLHAFVRGHKPSSRCRTSIEDGGFEVYENKRYLTMTGRPFGDPIPSAEPIPDGQGALEEIYTKLFAPAESTPPARPPSPIQSSDVEILDRAFNGKSGSSVRALWDGDISGYNSHSEADLALCSHLHYWAEGNPSRVDDLFRQSGLMRDKWNRADYRKRTLAKAAQGQNRVWEPRPESEGKSRDVSSSKSAREKKPMREAADSDRASEVRDSGIRSPGPHRPDSQLANAHRLANRCRDELCYVPGPGFHVFDGRRWVACKERAMGKAMQLSSWVFEEASELRRQASSTPDGDAQKVLSAKASRLERWVRQCEQAPTLEKSLALAQSLLRIENSSLDRRPELLNVENGTLDLRTGELRSHRPEDHLTRIAPVRFRPEARSPRWARFVSESVGHDQDSYDFLQAALGYSLTGLVDQQCLFYVFGSGQNGKSTLFDVLGQVLGPGYVTKAAPDLLVSTRGERHPSEVADLQGTRLVICQEIDDDKTLDSRRLKELTGERRIKARRFYEGWSEFEASFKIWIQANHLPQLRGDSFALWRRIRLVPFPNTVEKPDRGLSSALVTEKEGILAWLVQGAKQYFDKGLRVPDRLRELELSFRERSDEIGEFIASVCQTGKDLQAPAGHLREAYERFVYETGSRPITPQQFRRELEKRGYPRSARRASGYAYLGLALRSSLPEDGPSQTRR